MNKRKRITYTLEVQIGDRKVRITRGKTGGSDTAWGYPNEDQALRREREALMQDLTAFGKQLEAKYGK